MTSLNYQAFRKAILAGRPVSFMYKGYLRLACPHVIGTKGGLEKVLTFQYDGGSSTGLPPGGEWRCLFVSEAADVQMISDRWYTGASHTRPQTCVDVIDVQVFVSPDGIPYAQQA
jgi:hypothetical protein